MRKGFSLALVSLVLSATALGISLIRAESTPTAAELRHTIQAEVAAAVADIPVLQGSPGPQGERGQQGPEGPQGPPGSTTLLADRTTTSGLLDTDLSYAEGTEMVVLDIGQDPGIALMVMHEASGEVNPVVVWNVDRSLSIGGTGYAIQLTDSGGSDRTAGNWECNKAGNWDSATPDQFRVNCLFRAIEDGTFTTYMEFQTNLKQVTLRRPLTITEGNVRIQEPGGGINLRTPDGQCEYLLRVKDDGNLELVPGTAGC